MKIPQPVQYLKLPFLFNEKLLIKDLETAMKLSWIPHFNTSGYEGSWNSIALYAKDGDPANIHAMQEPGVILKETPVMKLCSYFQEVLKQFKCPFLSVRLLKLDPGAYIKPHRDHELGYENYNFRLHIPIVTHKKIEFILDGKQLQMLPGECWYTNVNYEHSVANKGTTPRVHLVVDGERNAWSDNIFFSLAPKENFEKPLPSPLSQETLKRTIAELERMNTPVANKLIAQMKQQLHGE
ncbi:aspartyl/asparaginyl beta-hydroxylase domain-containing protein [Ascidiimonas aurantiaca]|uniref:aspartyl/asparaginyl beta-hydroxylase domain-containing protein n=1 Tax=Ascidiimonas aurantiaca TaxID=1685432 RepID=UPI0030EDBAA4